MDIIEAWDESDLNWPQRKMLIEYLIRTYESMNAEGDGVTNSLKLQQDFGSSLVLLMGRLFKCLMKTILNDENCSLIVHLLSIFVTSTTGVQVSEEFVSVEDLRALLSVLEKHPIKYKVEIESILHILESLTRFSRKLSTLLIKEVGLVTALATLLCISSSVRLHELVCDILINCYNTVSYEVIQKPVMNAVMDCINSPRLDTKRSGLKLLRHIHCHNLKTKSILATVVAAGDAKGVSAGGRVGEEAVCETPSSSSSSDAALLLHRDVQLIQSIYPQLVRMLLSRCVTLQEEVVDIISLCILHNVLPMLFMKVTVALTLLSSTENPCRIYQAGTWEVASLDLVKRVAHNWSQTQHAQTAMESAVRKAGVGTASAATSAAATQHILTLTSDEDYLDTIRPVVLDTPLDSLCICCSIIRRLGTMGQQLEEENAFWCENNKHHQQSEMVMEFGHQQELQGNKPECDGPAPACSRAVSWAVEAPLDKAFRQSSSIGGSSGSSSGGDGGDIGGVPATDLGPEVDIAESDLPKDSSADVNALAVFKHHPPPVSEGTMTAPVVAIPPPPKQQGQQQRVIRGPKPRQPVQYANQRPGGPAGLRKSTTLKSPRERNHNHNQHQVQLEQEDGECEGVYTFKRQGYGRTHGAPVTPATAATVAADDVVSAFRPDSASTPVLLNTNPSSVSPSRPSSAVPSTAVNRLPVNVTAGDTHMSRDVQRLSVAAVHTHLREHKIHLLCFYRILQFLESKTMKRHADRQARLKESKIRAMMQQKEQQAQVPSGAVFKPSMIAAVKTKSRQQQQSPTSTSNNSKNNASSAVSKARRSVYVDDDDSNDITNNKNASDTAAVSDADADISVAESLENSMESSLESSLADDSLSLELSIVEAEVDHALALKDENKLTVAERKKCRKKMIEQKKMQLRKARQQQIESEKWVGITIETMQQVRVSVSVYSRM